MWIWTIWFVASSSQTCWHFWATYPFSRKQSFSGLFFHRVNTDGSYSQHCWDGHHCHLQSHNTTIYSFNVKRLPLTPKRVTHRGGGRRYYTNIFNGENLYFTSNKVYVCRTALFAGFNAVQGSFGAVSVTFYTWWCLKRLVLQSFQIWHAKSPQLNEIECRQLIQDWNATVTHQVLCSALQRYIYCFTWMNDNSASTWDNLIKFNSQMNSWIDIRHQINVTNNTRQYDV